MKKNILFFAITALLLIGGVQKAYSCMIGMGSVKINSPSGVISSTGEDYEPNSLFYWMINIGVKEKVRLKYYVDLHPESHIGIYNGYLVNDTTVTLGTSITSLYGFERGTIETDSINGCCVILFVPSIGSYGFWPGIEIEYSAATPVDSTIAITNQSTAIMGSQYVAENLGIGDTFFDIKAPLHVKALPTDPNYGLLSRYEGLIKCNRLYIDNFFGRETISGSTTTPIHVQGITIDDPNTTPSTLSSWIKQSPEQKSISFGDGANTYMTIKEGNVGIGVAPSSSYKLYVNGTTYLSGNVGIGKSASTNTTERLVVKGTITADTVKAFWKMTGSTSTIDATTLNVSGTSKLTGNVGIGIAPSTTSTEKLVVSGTTCIFGIEGTSQTLKIHNSTATQTATLYTNSLTGTTNGLLVGIGTSDAGLGFIWHRNNADIRIGTNNIEQMRITKTGKVGIGKNNPSEKLDVAGTVKATTLSATITRTDTVKTKKVILTDTPGADFVFDPNYKLPELGTVEEHVKEHQHLPGIAPAAKMEEEGIDVAELNMQLLQKVEELYLYAIEQNKRLSEQNEQIIEQNERIAEQSDQITEQNKQIESQNERISTLEKALEKK